MASVLINIDGKVQQGDPSDHDACLGKTRVDGGKAGAGKTGVVWIHIDGRNERDRVWVADQTDLAEPVRAALIARETRPRTEIVDPGALVNLRGLGETPEDDPDPLSSVRFWAEPGRVISVSYRTSASEVPVREAFMAGSITTPGDLLAEFARDMAGRLDPVVADLGDTVDFCESRLDAKRAYAVRRRLARARSQAIAFRRFVVPQVQALQSLAGEDLAWVEGDDRLHLRSAIDRFSRMAEELEAMRERAALISEELTDLRAEKMDGRALLLSIVALVFLPITFITGLLGMNVQGIPFKNEPWAFWGVVGLCVAFGLGMLGWFARAHWLRDR